MDGGAELSCTLIVLLWSCYHGRPMFLLRLAFSALLCSFCRAVLAQSDTITQSLEHMRERGESFPIPHDVSPPALLMQHADVKLNPGPWISDEVFL